MSKNDDPVRSLANGRTAPGKTTASERNEGRSQTYAGFGADSYHPGQPRIVTVGEALVDPAFVGRIYGSDRSNYSNRDHLGPRLPVLREDPEEYAPEDFEWSIAERPEGSDAELSFSIPTVDDQPRYDHGQGHVTEFVPDAPGTYVLELEAPDGVHEQTIYAFPEPPAAAERPPRVSLDAEYDAETDEFVVDADAALAPGADASTAALEAVFLADDRDALATEDVRADETTARVPVSALDGESARIHAAAYDGRLTSVVDTVELSPDGAVTLPNRPPAWIEDSVVYEIFTRSFHGQPGQTDFDVLEAGIEYMDDLGVDVVWLTPIVPSASAAKEISGGGPHGYDTLDYFDVAPDLAPDGEDPIEAYRSFVEACHDRDIRVVFDFVANHCGRDHEFFQASIDQQGEALARWPRVDAWDADSKYYDWFDRVHEARYDGDGLVEPEPRVTGFFDLLDMPNWNFDNLAVREHLLAAADFWSGEIGVDGFRCDIAWGVPHDFWKDVREVVRSNNDEFLLLDESIPHDPAFAENEFDMHFDTVEYTGAAHDIARGEGTAFDLLDAVEARAEKGFPDHTLLLNATENHDEARLLNEALHAGAHDDPEHVQRAVWAASVALPGVPFVYSGQERQISKYGEGRHRGEGDDRDADVRPGGKQRAFMNWAHQGDTVPEEHLQFYSDVIDLYHETDALGPNADLEDVWFRSDDHALVFGRDASDVVDAAGPERAVVVVNFDSDGPARVELPSGVDTIDRFTGTDLAADAAASGGDATPDELVTVEVDTIAVFETPTFDPLGEPIAVWDGDAAPGLGPGHYEFPLAEDFAPGSFDLESFELREFDDSYQFVFEFDAIENPWNRDRGFSVQLPQVYVREPDAGGGSVYAQAGVNARFEDEYHHRVLARPMGGVTVESPYGDVRATGGAEVLADRDAVVVWVGKDALPDLTDGAELVPLVTAFDETRTDHVRPVEAEASQWTFGGGREDDMNPNVLDLVTPSGMARADALAYSGEELATIPFLDASE
ncbi:Glycosidase [Natronoarchaeum philippinense]|uniref:Glycosidase n=1 Tax=Natronoarchaeum philippinense TaxID=558529 RepID=A0A285NTY4_NATPI|nr:glucodextranase DOMON-like domain-containing protein [Natronoarchaeum philippinense]SNZ12383.1 Glycosidase [Natronoarchaeum philippinense]